MGQFWRLENWDRVAPDDHRRVEAALKVLRIFTISTADQAGLRAVFSKLRSGDELYLHGAAHINPFNWIKREAFIVDFTEGLPERTCAITQEAANKLPGLAALPGGLEFICERAAEATPLEILEAYVNRLQSGATAWWLAWLLYSPLQLDRDPQALVERAEEVVDEGEVSAQIIWGSGSKRTKGQAREIAQEMLNELVSEGVMRRAGERKYRFVVPEAGFLVMANRLCQGYRAPELRSAFNVYKDQPNSRFAQILLAYAARKFDQGDRNQADGRGT